MACRGRLDFKGPRDGKKSGYIYTITATPADIPSPRSRNPSQTPGAAPSFPIRPNVIRQNWTQEPATATSPELK